MITFSSREKRTRPLHHGQLEIAVLFFFDQPLLLISFEGRRSRSVRRAVVVYAVVTAEAEHHSLFSF